MKTIITMVMLSLASVCAPACVAQSGKAQQGPIKTETFTVRGNCEECKERIENAADIKGVKKTVWNAETQVATVTYDTEKTSVLKIQEAIASFGHDAGSVKASDKKYKSLPKCCQYRDRKCEDPGGK
jgi:periplasmic mercuric ion binding protein